MVLKIDSQRLTDFAWQEGEWRTYIDQHDSVHGFSPLPSNSLHETRPCYANVFPFIVFVVWSLSGRRGVCQRQVVSHHPL